MSIDLSRLDALKVPTEDFEVEIVGKKHTFSVSAFGDSGFLDITAIDKKDSIDAENKIRKYILVKSCGLTEEQADKLLFCDAIAASKLANRAIKLSNQFADERDKMAAEAEKNSGAASAATNA